MPETVCPGESPEASKEVEEFDGFVMRMPDPPDSHIHEYVYGLAPPLTLAVASPVSSVEFAPEFETEVGDIESDGAETFCIVTETTAVAEWLALSMTVQSATPFLVDPLTMPLAVNEVAFDVGELIVIPEPPDCHVQE